LNNLSFIPQQNRDGVREVMNVSDAVLVSYKPLPVLETGSPHKYFDGLAAGKLVIVNVKGWMKDEVEKNGCGISVDAKNPDDLLNKVAAFISSPDRLKSFQASSRKLAEALYSRKLLGEAFSGFFL
jgi:glycosyltransferase involved in cell wall biosynthesis